MPIVTTVRRLTNGDVMLAKRFGAEMLVPSTRFGKLQVEHQDLLLMPQGLIGFETCRHWVLLADEGQSNVAWLHSVGLANVALPVISPRRFAPDYRVHVTERDLTRLKMRGGDQVFVLTVVSKNGMTLTTNLKSPLLINATQRVGIQIVSTENAPLALPIGLVDRSVQITHPQKRDANTIRAVA